MKALAYLHYRLFVNSVKSVLRSPKKLIPALLIGLYFTQSFFFLLMGPRANRYGSTPFGGPGLSGLPLDVLWSAIFALLTLASISVVYSALSDGLLVFSASHIDFLFPTPVNKRWVLSLKLSGDYLRYALYGGFFFFLVFGGLYRMLHKPAYPGPAWSWAGAVLLMIFVFNVTHILNIVASRGANRLLTATRALRLTMLAIPLALIAVTLFYYTRQGNPWVSLVSAVRSDAARVMLLPVAWTTDAILAPINGQPCAMKVGWLTVLAVGSLIALLVRPESFYEPSLKISARMASVRAAARSGNWARLRTERRKEKGQKTFSTSIVPPFGIGAAALMWKSLVVKLRTSKWALGVIYALPPVACALIAKYAPDPALQHMLPFVSIYALWIFSTMAQQEMRSELKQSNIIKAMPISGFKTMAAMVLSSWVQLLVFLIIVWISCAALLPDVNRGMLLILMPGAASLALVLISAGMIPAIMYGETLDRLQTLLPQLVSMFLFLVTAVPSVGIGVLLWALHLPPWLVASLVVTLNAGISIAALAIAGRMFERYDPTDE